MSGNELPRRWNTEEERLAALEALANGDMPRSWPTSSAHMAARQAQTRRILTQLLTGKGLVKTQWAKEESERNHFEEEGEIGIA